MDSLYVRTLEAENECLRAQLKDKKSQATSPWHSVASGDLPEKAGWFFIVFTDGGGKQLYEKAYYDPAYAWLCGSEYLDAEVKYWMQIPELPKK